MSSVNARYIGTTEVWSVAHGKALAYGDVVKMPEAEALAREDFEIVKAPDKGPKSLPEKESDG